MEQGDKLRTTIMNQNSNLRWTKNEEVDKNTDFPFSLDFKLFQKAYKYRIRYEDIHLKLSDIVPLALDISDEIIKTTTEEVKNQGHDIQCKRGCSKCCEYMATVTVPEAVWLVENFRNISDIERRKIIINRSALISKDVQEYLIKYHIDNGNYNELVDDEAMDNIGTWYLEQKMKCPYLFDNDCGIYKYRPIACREFLISGDKCCNGITDKCLKVNTPIPVDVVLKAFTSQIEGSIPESILLAGVIDWFQDNIVRCEHKWPAEMVLRTFIESFSEVEKIYSDRKLFEKFELPVSSKA
jgi:Fe-S-cluster containining protein